jgi:dolichyl-phosphate beta-glucosyltransferase
MSGTPYLSVIVPAYNEADNFKRGTLSEITNFLKSQPFTWELLLVNDGSTDETSKLLHQFAAKHPRVKVIDNPHQGKAATIITGSRQASGQIILFSDMDQATPISELTKFLPKFSEGYDVVIGSRVNRQGAPLFRQILAFGMVALRTILLRLPYRDTQCGFKAFTKAASDQIFSLITTVHPIKTVTGPAVNPGFDVEMLYLGRKLGLRIAEIPVDWHHQESKRVSFMRDAIAGIQELFLVRYRSLTNAYNLRRT